MEAKGPIRPSTAWHQVFILPADPSTLQVQLNNAYSVPAGLTSILRETPTRTEGQYHEKHWEAGQALQLLLEPEAYPAAGRCLVYQYGVGCG